MASITISADELPLHRRSLTLPWRAEANYRLNCDRSVTIATRDSGFRLPDQSLKTCHHPFQRSQPRRQQQANGREILQTFGADLPANRIFRHLRADWTANPCSPQANAIELDTRSRLGELLDRGFIGSGPTTCGAARRGLAQETNKKLWAPSPSSSPGIEIPSSDPVFLWDCRCACLAGTRLHDHGHHCNAEQQATWAPPRVRFTFTTGASTGRCLSPQAV